MSNRGKMHFVIPDVQDKPKVSKDFLRSLGQYIVHKRPDRIICLGDFADMESLSSYDKGKGSAEGRRYAKDIESAHAAMESLLGPIRELNLKLLAENKPIYRPTMDLFLGNHEERILRAANDSPEMIGTVSLADLQYEKYGWTVHEYREVRTIDGVAYSHFLSSGAMGRPIGSASALLSKRHQSCVVGHQQGYQIATAVRADGKMLTGIIAGSCYEHEEDYLGPQGNRHWRGFLILHDVNDGEFSTQQVSLRHLNAKFPFDGSARKQTARLLVEQPVLQVPVDKHCYLLKAPPGVNIKEVIAKGLAK